MESIALFSLLGVAMISLITGMLSPFVFTRQQSLIGDAMAHWSLPGVVLAIVAVMSIQSELGIGLMEREQLVASQSSLGYQIYLSLLSSLFLLGVPFLFSVAVFSLMRMIKNLTHLKNDAILALLQSGFFGMGLVAYNFLESSIGERAVSFFTILYGNAAALWWDDIVGLTPFVFLVIGVVCIFFRSFKLIAFDKKYAQFLSLPTGKIERILDLLVLLVVIIGVKLMGALFVGVLLVAPAVAAGCFTNKFFSYFLLSIFFSLTSAMIGVFLSLSFVDFPTGPAVAFSAVMVAIIAHLHRFASLAFKKI